ncbi:MAG: zinc-binding dehydrogenase [Pseudomonadota bacterium]
MIEAAICRLFNAPLSIEKVNLAKPQKNEVEVTLKACALCHSDIHYIDGCWGGDLPAIYGHEASGVVSDIGSHVKNIKEGDHVVVTLIRSCGACPACSTGRPVLCKSDFETDQRALIKDQKNQLIHQGLRTAAFAEKVVVDASQIVVIDRDIGFLQASLLACGVITGVGAVVNTACIQAGARVGIIGAGGVGLNAIQGADLAGASQIIAVDIEETKLETACQFGATHVINSKKDDLKGKIKQFTAGEKLETVFVTVGSKSAIEQGLTMLSFGGRLIIVGMPASDVRASFDPSILAAVEQQIIGSKMGSTRINHDIPWLISMYKQGRLKLDELISNQYPLSKINDAIIDSKNPHSIRNLIVFDKEIID